MEKQTSQGQTANIYPVPKPIVWVGRFLQFFSVKWAAAYSRYFFMLPQRHGIKPAERQWREQARQWDMDVEAIGKKVRMYEWGKGDKKVLLAHGWSGRGSQFIHLGRRLVERGYRVIAFDAPAHGQSGGKRTLMLHFIETIKAAEVQHGPFHAIIGHSMGGIAALNAVGSHGVRPGYLVTIGIPDSIKRIFYQFAAIMGLKPDIARLNIEYLARVYGSDIDSLAGSYNAGKVEIPTLIVHDRDDKEVPYTEAISIAGKLPQGHLLLTRGLGHRRILRNKEVIKQILDFLEGGNVGEKTGEFYR